MPAATAARAPSSNEETIERTLLLGIALLVAVRLDVGEKGVDVVL